MRIPELLSPAGNMDALRAALHFGADAVYGGMKKYGLRAFAGNFDPDELREAVALTHTAGKKFYVTMNSYPFDDELDDFTASAALAAEIGVDAAIVADPGAIVTLHEKVPQLKIHVSTQANTVNAAAAELYRKLGCERVILAREMSLDRIRALRKAAGDGIQLETFVHGASCMAYSGRCMLSAYLAGRSGNRGECAQPCRWKYALVEEKRPGQYFEISEDNGTFIMNSQDLNMIEHLQDLADAGVSSFKIEGRTKSAYYTAVVTNAYRHAIDAIAERDPVPELWVRETEQVSHRPYCTGFYLGKPSQVTDGPSYFSGADVMAVVESCDENGNAILTQRNKFSRGDTLELLTPDGGPVSFTVEHLFNTYGEEIEDARHAMMEVHMHLPKAAPRLSLVRKRR